MPKYPKDSSNEHNMLKYYQEISDEEVVKKIKKILRKEDLLHYVNEIACLHYDQLVELDSTLYGPV